MAKQEIPLEKFLELEGQVIEPVPESERSGYTYWRGAHLGAIALNFINGKDHLNNAWGAPYTHFWGEYAKAATTARGLSKPDSFRQSQFGEEHRAKFSRLAGVPLDFAYPSIVLALDKPLNGKVERIRSTNWDDSSLDEIFDPLVWSQPLSPGGGFLLRGNLTLDKIDPHSRREIRNLFNL